MKIDLKRKRYNICDENNICRDIKLSKLGKLYDLML